jgi:hypothetical protein
MSESSSSCDWCGQTTEEGSKLCEACAWSKEQSEQQELERHRPKPGIMATIWEGVVFCGKGMLAAFLSLLALVAGLVGTCGTLGAVFGGGAGVLVFAVVGFGAMALLLWLIYIMYHSDFNRPTSESIRRSLARKSVPKQIGKSADSATPSISPDQQTAAPENRQADPEDDREKPADEA